MVSFRCQRLELLSVVFVMLMAASAVKAQTITGSISGVITDSTGAYIPGATVTLTSEKTAQARSGGTNGEGRFTFAALQPGGYYLKVEQPGFQTFEQRGVI